MGLGVAVLVTVGVWLGVAVAGAKVGLCVCAGVFAEGVSAGTMDWLQADKKIKIMKKINLV